MKMKFARTIVLTIALFVLALLFSCGSSGGEMTTPVYKSDLKIAFEGIEGHGVDLLKYNTATKEYDLLCPEKTGYKFVGWKKNGEFVEKVSVIEAMESITLTAEWEIIDYSINYKNIDGAENSNPSKYNCLSDTILLNDPEKSGYLFIGWFNEEHERVEAIGGGSVGDLSLSARFTPIDFSITYAGTEGSEHTNPSSYNTESSVSLSDAVRRGYSFGGWFCENGERITEIRAGSVGDLTLRAEFTLLHYNINFTGTDGAENPNPTSYTVNSETIILSDAVKEGYSFDGWFTDENNKITNIPSGSVEDITAEARFSIIDYSIVYKGTDDAQNTNPVSYNIESGEIVLSDALKTGYVFEGWFDEKGNKITSIPPSSFGDLILEARFTAKILNISFTGIDGINEKSYCTYDESGVIILNTVSKKGYDFDGWFTEDGRKISEISADTQGEITVEARFTLIRYSIFYIGIEPGETDNPESFTVNDTVYLNAPIAKDRYFEGWYSGESEIGKIEEGTATDITLTAKWSADLEVGLFQTDSDFDQSNNTPIPCASVNITGNGVDMTVVTSSLGSCSFERLPTGEYTLTVSKESYTDISVSVKVNLNISLDLYMDAEQTTALQGYIFEADSDLDHSNNERIHSASITLKKLNGSPSLSETVKTDEHGGYFFDSLTTGIYLLSVAKSGYIGESAYVKISEYTDTVQNFALEIVKCSDADNELCGGACGMVYDALLNGNRGVAGLTLTVRSGINNANRGEILGIYTTEENGSYTITDLSAGNYTVTVTDERSGIEEDRRYTASYFNIKVLQGQTVKNQNGSVFLPAGEESLRIILSWGSSPADLDSHLTGTAESGGRFHVYYNNRTYSTGKVSLDRDDTDGLGPETITVEEPQSGIYRFSIHNCTDKDLKGSLGIGNSGATVKVYIGQSLVHTFYAPACEGNLWTVFEYNAETGDFTPINIMSDQTTPEFIT